MESFGIVVVRLAHIGLYQPAVYDPDDIAAIQWKFIIIQTMSVCVSTRIFFRKIVTG